jgi:hypothetical protein
MSELSLGLSAMPAAERRVDLRRHFFDVSVVKLVVMSIVTFGLYEIYWFYKQWQARKESGQDVLPLPRAIFAVLFAHALFKEAEEIGRDASVEVETKPSTYACRESWLFLPKPF